MACCLKHRLMARRGAAPAACGPVLGRRQFLAGAAATGGVALVSGCSVNPYTGREQLMLVSDTDLARMSLSTWQQVQRKYRRGGTGRERAAVRRVGRDMVDASGLGGSRDWEFEVFEGPSNAFVLPGGQVAVFTGIMEEFENDAQMAAVVGHEVGHVAARHSAERVSQQMLASLVVGGTAAVLAGMGTDSVTTQIVVGALGAGASFGVLLPYSRKHELEADRLGVEYMAQKGYDPREALEFWEDRTADGEQGPPEFASTHPSGETRIAQISQMMPEAMAVYRQNTQGSGRAEAPLGGQARGLVDCSLDGEVVTLTAETCVEVGGMPL
jgi:predicted Zn-dependent protease